MHTANATVFELVVMVEELEELDGLDVVEENAVDDVLTLIAWMLQWNEKYSYKRFVRPGEIESRESLRHHLLSCRIL